MKKILGIVVALALVVGFAGTSSANLFANGDLVRVVYDTQYDALSGLPTGGSNQTYTDLGSLASLNGTHNDVVGTNINALTGVATGGSLSGLQVAYFVYGPTPSYIGAATDPIRTGSSFSSLAGGMNSSKTITGPLSVGVAGLQSGPALPDSYTDAQSDAKGYWLVMNGAAPGSYGQYLNAGAAEAGLAGLTTTGIQFGLYGYTTSTATGSAGTQYTNGDGSNFTILTFLNTDGNAYTEINPTSVPIPAAVWLLGSGLLGLIGIRRRA